MNWSLNIYSVKWFSTFLAAVEPAQTEYEADFIARQLPRAGHGRILDLCCGTGRHARALAARGYQVTGLDRSAAALQVARMHAVPGVDYVQSDMSGRVFGGSAFDGIVCLWQSFGYHDDETNLQILEQLHGQLRPGGRFVLDIYHRGFFERHQGERVLTSNGGRIIERKYMSGARLTVELDHGNGVSDVFEWRLYHPDEISNVAEACGFSLTLCCAGFDESLPSSATLPRMQLVLAR